MNLVYRVILLRSVAALYATNHICAQGSMVRDWGTTYRGPVAFIGPHPESGRAIICGVACLSDVRAMPHPAGNFRWILTDTRLISLPCDVSIHSDRWEVRGGEEPAMLPAYLQTLLNERVPPLAASVATAPVTHETPEVNAPPTAPREAPPEPVAILETGQATLF